MLRIAVVLMALLAVGCRKAETPAAAPVASYVDPRQCAGCHAAIWKSYQASGMAKAFSRVAAGAVKTGKFEHRASGRSYEVLERGGRFFGRRTVGGKWEIEREIHYVMGSGRKARSYIHRGESGRLTELPVGWYAEGGGTLGMSPGYDRAEPLDFRRKISFDCMFCHNGYPAMAAGTDRPSAEPVFPAALPEGIDCQRCHGPGSLHVKNGGKGGIYNPKGEMEVCMQCHLETTSRPLPNALVRFDRGAFSYRAGEKLGDFQLYFDHAKGTGREDKFEIVSSVYRLRQSVCFVKSGGKLSCTTCHNPHEAKKVDAKQACLGCHGEMGKKAGHPAGANCFGCHMPERRTEDVVHATMTDHKIVRRPPAGNLTAMRAETHEARFDGPVELYYPAGVREAEVYLAVAQVAQGSNLQGGIPRLEALGKSPWPQVAFALAQAYEKTGRLQMAESKYRETGDYAPGLRALGELLTRQGRVAEAVTVLERARGLAGADAGVAFALGMAYRDAGRMGEALGALEAAVQLDFDYPAAHNALGGLYFARGDAARAEAAVREAVRQQPEYGEARLNLGQMLGARGAFAEAEENLREAVGRGAAGWRPLGDVLAAQEKWGAARAAYLEAVKVDARDGGAWTGLAGAQAALGDARGAQASLEKAAALGEAEAREALRRR